MNENKYCVFYRAPAIKPNLGEGDTLPQDYCKKLNSNKKLMMYYDKLHTLVTPKILELLSFDEYSELDAIHITDTDFQNLDNLAQLYQKIEKTILKLCPKIYFAVQPSDMLQGVLQYLQTTKGEKRAFC